MAKNARLIDMTGRTCGEWAVIRKAGNVKGGGATWLCRCKCGTERAVLGSDLRKGKSTNCGCAATERIARLRKTHGATKTRLYSIWKNMRSRCNNPRSPQFKDYGGRGILICEQWDNFTVFADWARSNGYRDDLSIERVDVNLGYDPNNCVWADAQAQSENRRFVAKAPDGRLWYHVAKSNGISDGAYRTRLFNGWPHEEAATHPAGKRRQPRKRDEQGRFR